MPKLVTQSCKEREKLRAIVIKEYINNNVNINFSKNGMLFSLKWFLLITKAKLIEDKNKKLVIIILLRLIPSGLSKIFRNTYMTLQ
ncbi:hypothetical protein GCM10022257_08410 [Hyunsoonleella aestuarii]|uniref:Uncharacterized protein n=1 Tax=Hyunsoonleella aestuarii TaxID=912802 RepID=A0ABP8E944_9FLAO